MSIVYFLTAFKEIHCAIVAQKSLLKEEFTEAFFLSQSQRTSLTNIFYRKTTYYIFKKGTYYI